MKPKNVCHKVRCRMFWRAVINVLMPCTNRSHNSGCVEVFQYSVELALECSQVLLWMLQLEAIVAGML